ncbi:MAG: rod shape-determining protein RodA [Actinomycetota bacterium]
MDTVSGQHLPRDHTPFRHLDPILLLTGMLLSVVGLLVVFSATHQSLEALGEDPGFFATKQGAFVMVGIIALIVAATFNYRLTKTYAYLAYAVVFFLLLMVMTPIGSRVAGAQRWLSIFGFQFQPSEFGKLALIAALATYLSELRRGIGLDNVWRAAGLAIGPIVLVFFQPDVGTAMTLAAILLAMLIVSGAKAKHIAILALVAVIGVFFAFQVGIVKEYQIARLTGFIDPTNDPLRAGYNRRQAEIAIGNGGLTGTGYLHGTQTNLDFVPEQHTDFVFTVVGEEFGFIGAAVLLSLYGILLWRGFRIANVSKDAYGTLLTAGIVTMLAFQIFVNVGMTMGIMPITGIPLPMVSYGGSSLITNFLAIGLLLNIHMRRFT